MFGPTPAPIANPATNIGAAAPPVTTVAAVAPAAEETQKVPAPAQKLNEDDCR